MTPERIAELRSSVDVVHGHGYEECIEMLDEIDRLQGVMSEVATSLQRWADHAGHMPKNVILSTLAQQLLDARAAKYPQPSTEKVSDFATTSEPRNRSQVLQPDTRSAPTSERCNATWRYPDDGCMPEHRGERYACTMDAGHSGQHLESGRATWSDGTRGAKPHTPAQAQEPEQAEEPYKASCAWCGWGITGPEREPVRLDVIRHAQACAFSPIVKERDQLRAELAQHQLTRDPEAHATIKQLRAEVERLQKYEALQSEQKAKYAVEVERLTNERDDYRRQLLESEALADERWEQLAAIKRVLE